MPMCDLPFFVRLCQVKPFIVFNSNPHAFTTANASVGIGATHHIASKHWSSAMSATFKAQSYGTVINEYLWIAPRWPALALSR